jgi:hypothetical protein
MVEITDINSRVCVCVCVCVYFSDVSYTNFVNKEENKQSKFNLLTFAQTGPNLTCMCTTGTIDSWNPETLMWGYLLSAQNSVSS